MMQIEELITQLEAINKEQEKSLALYKRALGNATRAAHPGKSSYEIIQFVLAYIQQAISETEEATDGAD